MSQPFDILQLTEDSRAFAEAFLARFPDLRKHCSTEPLDAIPGQHLLIQIPSPAGADRNVMIWMNGGDEPSLGFGECGWHTHQNNIRYVGDDRWIEESLLDLLDAILSDECVTYEEPDAKPRPFSSVLDLREPDALADELTDPNCSDWIRIKTFSGTNDRDVRLADLTS